MVVPCGCEGLPRCTWCRQRRRAAEPWTRRHALTYTADQTDHVHLRVDQPYRAEQWELWSVSTTPEAQEQARAFLDAQVGGPFDASALYFNAFWGPWVACCPRSWLRHCARGVQRGLYNPERKWFCTELCVAALQVLGLFADETPCVVDPGRLRALLNRDPACCRLQ